ncbi:MAG: AI-2E family transporter [Desulfobacterales bacterium]
MPDAPDQSLREKCPTPAKPQVWHVLQEAADQKRVMLGLFVLGVLYSLYFARDLLIPVFIALYLTMFLQPLVRGLQRIHIPPMIGAAVMVILLLLLFFSAFVWLSTPAGEWLDRAPGIIKDTKHKLYDVKKKVEEARKTTEQLKEMTNIAAGKNDKVVVEGPSLTQQVIGQTRNLSLAALIVIVLLYLFLAWGGIFLKQLAQLFGESQAHRQMITDIRREFGRYLFTITVINAVLGIVTVAMTAVFGLPSPWLWGVVAGSLNFIPYLGGAITTIILTLVSLVTHEKWLDILLPPLIFITINGLEGNIITPIILGKRLALNPIIVFLSLLFWGWMWGVVGLFLATPILVTLLISGEKLNLKKPFGNPSDEPIIKLTTGIER